MGDIIYLYVLIGIFLVGYSFEKAFYIIDKKEKGYGLKIIIATVLFLCISPFYIGLEVSDKLGDDEK